MASDVQSARDDLAYMRGLVSGTGPMQATIGECFFWAGLLYGGQCFLHWLQTLEIAPSEGLGALAIAFVPTIAFCAILTVIIWKDRKTKVTGVAARALGAVFQGAGLANLVMAFVFAYGANKAESFGLWLYHPIVVSMFQGVAWFVAWVILRKPWIGFVAAGWFIMTVALGVAVYESIGAYLLTLAIGLTVLMAIPGWIIWRGAKRAA
ncbi:hypothetical protein [Terricaulis silvestris]|uniref:Uncharacterized protein n=1 Tax=Terricaulis silvestris TaxID=2686094 RepID=A0A6I6MLM0_9CAUL|nr:hypothetical protein [Terricaulis silvestris]QGZ96315.1 hypothetical protein DSM104635_03173 [Terricaulis silvestris]